MKTIKPFVVDMAVYPFDILVCFGHKPDDVKRYLVKKCGVHKLEAAELDLNSLGKLIKFHNGATLLWTKTVPKKGCPILMHEIFHAVHNILDRVGIKLTDESEEAYAYAIQYLTNEINKRL